ncbi:unnamed protein product [Orchesella dallaii]|uniref:Uncharacterized protein n=1 Tax=Orchesella dallaii TaxID=48710 RepID=A0ABP1QXD9_9HEXA
MNTSHRISTLLLILWMKLSPHEHCISQTPSDPPVNSICIGTGGSYKDFLTLGQQILVTSLAGGGDGFSMPGNSVDSGNNYAPTDTLFLEIWAMKRKNSDHFLSGWLYIRALTGPGNSNTRLFNRVMYTQMEDENGNAVGEFESTEYCHTDPPYTKWNPDDFFAPCGQVAPSAERVSNAMMFTSWNLVVNSQEREALKQFYDSNLYHFGPSVYFKFSHTSCNKPEKIRLRAYVRSTPRTYSDRIYSYGTLRTNWMKINWTGAADILHVGEKAECYSKLVYIFPGQVQDVTGLPWIERVEPTIPVKEETSNQDIYRTKKFCKAVRFKIGEDHRHAPTFAGRCLKHDEYNVSRNYKHDCKAGATADYKNFRNESFMKYSEYLKKRMSCMKISRCPCQCRVGRIDNMSGLANPVCPGSYFDSNKTTNQFELGVPVNTTAGMSILVGDYRESNA